MRKWVMRPSRQFNGNNEILLRSGDTIRISCGKCGHVPKDSSKFATYGLIPIIAVSDVTLAIRCQVQVIPRVEKCRKKLNLQFT